MMTPVPSKVVPTTQPPTTTTTEATTTTTMKATTTEETTTEPPTTTTTSAPTTTEIPTTTTTEQITTTTTAMTTTTRRPKTTTPKPTTTTTVRTTTTTTTTAATTTTRGPTTTTTARPTTTTRATTTTLATTTPDPTDTRYSATSSFHLSDLLSAGTPVYQDGPVHPSEDGPDGFGSAADLSENEAKPERSCLKVNDLTSAGRSSKTDEEHNRCWRNPLHCKQGFSASVFAKVAFDRRDTSKRFLFSTGGDDEGTPGVAVYYKGIYVHALVSTGEYLWTLSVAGLEMNDTWSNVAFTWNQKEGLDLYLNGKRKALVAQGRPLPPPPRQPLKPLQLTLGCRRLGKGAYDDFVRGMLDEFVTWQHKVPEENASYFMGGMDTSKLCKPEKHPMKCSTDMKTLLKEMDTMDLSNVDTAMTTIMHIAEVAKATAKKTSSRTSNKGGSSSSGSGTDGSDPNKDDEDEQLKKIRLNNLRDMIAIVKKLVNKTSGPLSPGVDPQDLSVLYKVQEIMSTIYSESQADLWKELEKEGEDGVALTTSVQDWGMAKLQEAKSEEKEVDLLMISENMASKSIKGSPEELKKKHEPYLYFPDYGKDPQWQQLRKRWGGAADQLRVPTSILEDSGEAVSIQSVYYNTFHKMAPTHNSITDGNASGVFLDSRVISFDVKPSYNRDVLVADPVIIFLEHFLEKKKSLQQNPSDEELKVETWECVRWSDTLEVPDRMKPGGWTTEGCARVNSTEYYTTCACNSLGMFALLALPPVPKKYVEPEDETWLFAVRGLGYSFSIIILICYISAIAMRQSLHDQFHIIRLNLAIAAVGTMLSFFSVDFKRHDWGACRVLSGFIHYFYMVVGCWMAILTHALFKGFIRGVVEGRERFYLLVGWGLPLVWVGIVVASSPNYGYEDRCMVGPSKGLRCSLVCPLTFISLSCLLWSAVVCCNLSSPQIKRQEVVEELNYSTKMLFCLSLAFTGIWIPGFFAWLELDLINLREWRKAFQILNSWMGVFIVFFLGLGSKHFRYAVFDKYVKYLNILFHSNRINPTPFEYTNGYRFDYKHYYY